MAWPCKIVHNPHIVAKANTSGILFAIAREVYFIGITVSFCKPIEDINAYAAVLDELSVGEETSVVVVRGEERVCLTVKVGSRR